MAQWFWRKKTQMWKNYINDNDGQRKNFDQKRLLEPSDQVSWKLKYLLCFLCIVSIIATSRVFPTKLWNMNQSQLLGSFRPSSEWAELCRNCSRSNLAMVTYAYRWRDFNKSTVIVYSLRIKIQLKYLHVFAFKGNKHRLSSMIWLSIFDFYSLFADAIYNTQIWYSKHGYVYTSPR